MTDFHGWEKKARELVKEDESDEEQMKEQSNKRLGLREGVVEGPPVAMAKEQNKQFKNQSTERKGVIEKMKAKEETYSCIVKNVFDENPKSVENSNDTEPETTEDKKKKEAKIANVSTFKTDPSGKFATIVGNERAIRVQDSKDSDIRFTGKTAKVFINKCENCNLDIMDNVQTSTAEIFGAKNCVFNVHTPVQSIQIDGSHDITFNFDDGLFGDFIVQHNCTGLKFFVAGKEAVNDSESVDVTKDLELQYVTQLKKGPKNSFVVKTEVVQRHQEKEFPTFFRGKNGKSGDAPTGVVTTSTSTDNVAEAAQKKQAGNDAFKANDFMQAAAMYTLSLAAVNDSVVLSNRAQCWLKTGQFEKAIADCEEGLELDESNQKLQFRLGVAYQAQAQLELDKEADRKFNRNHIQYKDVQEWLQKALKAFGEAERIDPKNKQVKEAIGFAQLKLNKAMQLGIKK